MTDQVLALLERMSGAPSLVVRGSRRLPDRKVHVTEREVVFSERIGQGERWALERVIPLASFAGIDSWHRQLPGVRDFVHRAVLFNPAAHGRAMGARTL